MENLYILDSVPTLLVFHRCTEERSYRMLHDKSKPWIRTLETFISAAACAQIGITNATQLDGEHSAATDNFRPKSYL